MDGTGPKTRTAVELDGMLSNTDDVAEKEHLEAILIALKTHLI